MIKFYTNRELSQKLGINLAKWKRWSREFLPPDPLGGMQSGFARQYSPDEAFIVNLGGYLVANLKFSIPEAKQILKDLNEWLLENGFFFDGKGNAELDERIHRLIKKYRIYILRKKDFHKGKYDFHFKIRGIISINPVVLNGFQVVEKRYLETIIGRQPNGSEIVDEASVRILNITDILERFVENLGQVRGYYQALS